MSGRQACKGIYYTRWQVTFTPATLENVQPVFAALEKANIYKYGPEEAVAQAHGGVCVMQDRNTLQVYIPT